MDIRVVDRDKTQKEFDKADSGFAKLIKEGFGSNTLLYVQAEGEEGNMQIEFGDKCCNIQMDNEEIGEAYMYINPDDDNDESADLWANSYPHNMLCYNVGDALKILGTFIDSGEPDGDYEWDVKDI